MEIDRAKVAQDEKLDGKWLVITNDASLSAEDVALGTRHLLRVEESVRRLEHGIDIRPGTTAPRSHASGRGRNFFQSQSPRPA